MYKWFVFLGFVLLISCKGASGVPGNVLDYNEMKEIMWDMSQVDEFVMVYVKAAPQKIKEEHLAMYEKVFALHKITNDDFIKSFSFYKSHPLQEKVLMDSLLQFSTRQRQDRFVPSFPIRQNKLINPAPIQFNNRPNDWHQYQFPTNFSYE